MDEQAYLKLAEQAGLPEPFATLSWQWAQAHPVSTALQQHPSDLVDAFRTARQLHPYFCTLVELVARDTQGKGFTRPGSGIKSADRVLEKMLVNRKVPLDLLGGKVVFGQLQEVYQALDSVKQHCTIRAFNDRFIHVTPSGYRDVQMLVELPGGHIAELKLVLRAFDELDHFEHHIYEIRRALHARTVDTGQPLSQVEQLVFDELGQSSQTMYMAVWQSTLAERRPE